MKTFQFYFLDGKVREGTGESVAEAFASLGFEDIATPVHPFFEEGGVPSYTWKAEERQWQKS